MEIVLKTKCLGGDPDPESPSEPKERDGSFPNHFESGIFTIGV